MTGKARGKEEELTLHLCKAKTGGCKKNWRFFSIARGLQIDAK